MILNILAIYYLIGPLCFLPLSSAVLFLTLQKWIFSKYGKIDQKRRELMDKRSKMTTEMIKGIKNIKFDASEDIIYSKFKKIRKEEKSLLQRMFAILTSSMSILWIITSVTGFIVFLILKLSSKDDDFSLGALFAFLMLLTRLGFNLGYLFQVRSLYVSALPSYNRFTNFMRLKNFERGEQDEDGMEPGSVSFEGYSASWDDPKIKKQIEGLNFDIEEKIEKSTSELHLKEHRGLKDSERQLTLSNLNLKIHPGEFLCIVGKMGSGKSSLLKSIIGELSTLQGTIRSRGSLAFVSQKAFLVKNTLKENIIFGKKFDEFRYKKTLKMCQLERDLSILPQGDQTQIGERGINLSGGQKQRISLARAVYSDSDIYLIDDCLSALDAYVGQAIVDEVLLGYLKKKGKTVILASHHTQFLAEVDRVVLMGRGESSSLGVPSRSKRAPNSSSLGDFYKKRNRKERKKGLKIDN